jgi:hypothetical protein
LPTLTTSAVAGGTERAEWTIFTAGPRSSPERDIFWQIHGAQHGSCGRAVICRAGHIRVIRLERQRIGRVEELAETYAEMAEILAGLRRTEWGTKCL